MTIHWSKSNRKLKALARHLGLHYNQVLSFDLPAGWTCPFADKCLSMADRNTGKITDGDNCQFRCYASSIEAFSPNASSNHWDNFDAIRSFQLSSDDIAKIIGDAIPNKTKVVRLHASGDFFSRNYFDAWVKIAEQHPQIQFFGYTKGLQYVNADKPDNFNLVYSYGGKLDSKHTNEPACYVVPDKNTANELGIPVACDNNEWDDFHAIIEGRTFALELHGTQPAKS
jgi:hypothetical protein